MSSVKRGFDGEAAALEDVGVDHGGFDILVAEQFLDGADVVAILQKVGGEAVTEGMRGDGLVYFGEAGGLSDGLLENAWVGVVAHGFLRDRIG